MSCLPEFCRSTTDSTGRIYEISWIISPPALITLIPSGIFISTPWAFPIDIPVREKPLFPWTVCRFHHSSFQITLFFKILKEILYKRFMSFACCSPKVIKFYINVAERFYKFSIILIDYLFWCFFLFFGLQCYGCSIFIRSTDKDAIPP